MKETLVTHSFCGVHWTATYTWYLIRLVDKQYRCLNSYWFSLNLYYENNTKSKKGDNGSDGHSQRVSEIRKPSSSNKDEEAEGKEEDVSATQASIEDNPPINK